MDWVIGIITGLGSISGILTIIKRDKRMEIIQLIFTIIVPILISLWCLKKIGKMDIVLTLIHQIQIFKNGPIV